MQHAIEVGGNWVEDHQGMRGEVLAGRTDVLGTASADAADRTPWDSLSTVGFNMSNVSNRNGGAVAYRIRGSPAVFGSVRFD